MPVTDTAAQRQAVRTLLEGCLDDPTRLGTLQPAILDFLMEQAPQRLVGQSPEDVLVTGRVIIDISQRTHRLMIQRALRQIDSQSFEQLMLKFGEEIHSQSLEQLMLFFRGEVAA